MLGLKIQELIVLVFPLNVLNNTGLEADSISQGEKNN
jgi:hypothetical protein